jgi:orotate phosphoribosyltransferase
MNKEKAIKIFKSSGALMEGHFVLTSGRHSPSYFQCAKVLQYPEYLSLFANELTKKFESIEIETVISPAVGGIVIGTEVGRQLGVRTIFSERKDGKMILRRGFSVKTGEKILIVEDVVTTGGSVKEVQQLVEQSGGEIVGVTTIVDRSNGVVKLHKNQFTILMMEAISYADDELPDSLKKIPIEKPGSRELK